MFRTRIGACTNWQISWSCEQFIILLCDVFVGGISFERSPSGCLSWFDSRGTCRRSGVAFCTALVHVKVGLQAEFGILVPLASEGLHGALLLLAKLWHVRSEQMDDSVGAVYFFHEKTGTPLWVP